jgi:hypothetical protein
LSDLNHSHHEIVQLIGQNLGLFAVGKKLVFVEGENSSIDRLTYHTISQTIDKELKIIPIGSVLNLMTLNKIEEQIRSTIFGIEIFMIRDRDGLDDNQINAIENSGRVKCLKRRHIENYFLDEEVLFMVAEQLYLTRMNSTLTIEYIKKEIKRIATESINFNLFKNAKDYLSLNYHLNHPKVKKVEAKTTNEIKKEIINGVQTNLSSLSNELDTSKISEWLDKEEAKLLKMLNSDEWINNFQGKLIFTKICADVLKGDALRVKQAYVDIALDKKPSAIQDLLDIFNAIK